MWSDCFAGEGWSQVETFLCVTDFPRSYIRRCRIKLFPRLRRLRDHLHSMGGNKVRRFAMLHRLTALRVQPIMGFRPPMGSSILPALLGSSARRSLLCRSVEAVGHGVCVLFLRTLPCSRPDSALIATACAKIEAFRVWTHGIHQHSWLLTFAVLSPVLRCTRLSCCCRLLSASGPRYLTCLGKTTAAIALFSAVRANSRHEFCPCFYFLLGCNAAIWDADRFSLLHSSATTASVSAGSAPRPAMAFTPLASYLSTPYRKAAAWHLAAREDETPDTASLRTDQR